jgi:NAD(P)-dependent dehydrogenase (short-subunit alcohol dehydrogenase family)
MRVQDKVVAVTGGGSGIGRQLVLQLIARGARVAAADIREEGLAETARLASAGDRLDISILDVTDRVAVHAWPDQVVERFGGIDGYISNAGIIQPFVRLNDLDYDAIERVINVNLYGAINMAKAFLPHLLERPEAHITNLSSMGGFLPVPGQTMYGAAKAAVKLMSEGLYAELLDTSVGVSVVMPGGVETDIGANSGVTTDIDPDDAPSFPTTSAPEAAHTILNGIEDGALHILVGRDAKMMNALVRTSPRRATHIISKQMKDLLG